MNQNLMGTEKAVVITVWGRVMVANNVMGDGADKLSRKCRRHVDDMSTTGSNVGNF